MLQTPVYKDKIYLNLLKDEIREKILNNTLYRNDIDNEEVYNFLKLLKIEKSSEKAEFKDISFKEWRHIVIKRNSNSSSLIFSKQAYTIYKILLCRDYITMLLFRFYNVLIKRKYFILRWIKILDIIMEKGKGLILGKLRIIQLIEVDLQLLMRIYFSIQQDDKI